MSTAAQLKPGQPVSVVALLRSADAESDLTAAMRSINGARVEIRLGSFIELGTKVVDLRPPSILLVDVALDDEAEMALLARILQKRRGEIPVIVTSANSSVEGIRRLMRMDVPDFLPQPITAKDVLAALEAATQKVQSAPSVSRRHSRVISLIKPCGGMGATTLAVAMAHAFARQRKDPPEVCLVDLDLQCGAVELYLDLHTQFDIGTIIANPERLDGAFLRGVAVRHKTGFDVLAGPKGAVGMGALSAELATSLVNTAAQEYDIVIVDLPQTRTKWTTAVLARSDLVVQVVQLTVPALRQARRQMIALAERGLGRIPLLVVANRHEASWFSKSISAKDAQNALGRPVDLFIANDYKTVSQALAQGVPLAEIDQSSKVQKQVARMVEAIIARLNEESDREPVAVPARA